MSDQIPVYENIVTTVLVQEGVPIQKADYVARRVCATLLDSKSFADAVFKVVTKQERRQFLEESLGIHKA